ncbi:MAG: response regulator [Patescibacteria group bacterium]
MSNKILAVDDDDAILGLTRESLQRAGFEVSVARTGKYALELFEAIGHDLVITDLTMPEMNGLQLIEEVLRISPSTPTILFTTETKELDETDTSFVTKILAKPASPKQIAEAVRSLLPA